MTIVYRATLRILQRDIQTPAAKTAQKADLVTLGRHPDHIINLPIIRI